MAAWLGSRVTSSAFGRWLDHVLDELADVALHAAIAYSVFLVHRAALLAGDRHALPRRQVCFHDPGITGTDLEAENRWEGKARIGVKPLSSPTRYGPDLRVPPVLLSAWPERRGSSLRPWAMPTCDGISGSCLRYLAGSTWPWRSMPFTFLAQRSRAWRGRRWCMPEPRLAVLVVARNEEKNLAACLNSARFAD